MRLAHSGPSYWSRCIRDCAPAVQRRFKSSMQMFFQAVHQQALFRANGVVPDLETYIDMRRDTSGCKPVFDLIEYSLDLELPDVVIEDPVIVALNQGANDLVTWSNVSAVPSSRSGILVSLKALTHSFFRTYSRITSSNPGEIRTT